MDYTRRGRGAFCHNERATEDCGAKRHFSRSSIHNQPREIDMRNNNAVPRLIALATCGLLALFSATVSAQEKPYTEGSVWFISMIKVKPGMMDIYLRDVLPLRKKINEEAKKQGLVLSSHVLSGVSSGRDDWDIMFMDEYKNWAAFDGINAKYDAIMSKLVGSEDKQAQLMTKRTEVREIFGDKVMQELIIK
jgi:hypothetical protein